MYWCVRRRRFHHWTTITAVGSIITIQGRECDSLGCFVGLDVGGEVGEDSRVHRKFGPNAKFDPNAAKGFDGGDKETTPIVDAA